MLHENTSSIANNVRIKAITVRVLNQKKTACHSVIHYDSHLQVHISTNDPQSRKMALSSKRKILTNQDNEPFCAAGVGMSCATIAGPWYLGRTSALV